MEEETVLLQNKFVSLLQWYDESFSSLTQVPALFGGSLQEGLHVEEVLQAGSFPLSLLYPCTPQCSRRPSTAVKSSLHTACGDLDVMALIQIAYTSACCRDSHGLQ